MMFEVVPLPKVQKTSDYIRFLDLLTDCVVSNKHLQTIYLPGHVLFRKLYVNKRQQERISLNN